MQQELNAALEIIESHSELKFDGDALDSKQGMKDADSLLARCEEVTAQKTPLKPKLRVIHHLACSGGSLITKCFSALSNVFILSEVHPHSYRHLPEREATFLPSDISTLAYQAKFPQANELAANIFKSSIFQSYEHLVKRGGTLVLRDHSHSDYCVGENIADTSTVLSLLKDDFEIKSLITVRNPIDCYASLVSNYWLHFSPSTFDEYCLRVLAFLAPYSDEQIINYETFTEDPQVSMKAMCDILELTYDEGFIDIFDSFLVTGDSGRKGTVIEPRSRREISASFKEEIKASSNFKLLCKKYKFNPKI